jgi:Ca2+-binding RTX toxin-like protein
MAQTHFKPLLDSIGVSWNGTTNQFDWDTSNTVAALQTLYTADPTGSAATFKEFADTLKLSGGSGQQVLDALHTQGSISGDGFAQLLADIGIEATTGNAGNDILRGGDGADTLSGMAGNDDIYGNGGADVMAGGTGDDYMQGGMGNDVYQFNLGDGQDVIFDIDYTTGNVDTLRFGAGISAGDITVKNSGYDLVLSINGSNEQVLIQNWGGGSIYHIERIEFADGSAWDAANDAVFEMHRVG